MVRVIKLLLFLLILIQVIGCLWIKFALQNQDPGNWIRTSGFQDNDIYKIYFSAIYFAAVTTTTIGYGDFAGTIHSEIVFIIVVIIIGSIYYSFFISIVSNVFSNRAMVEHKINERISYIEAIKRNHNIPDELVTQLYLKSTNNNNPDCISDNYIDESDKKSISFYEILSQYPASIQYEVRMKVNKAIDIVKFLK